MDKISSNDALSKMTRKYSITLKALPCLCVQIRILQFTFLCPKNFMIIFFCVKIFLYDLGGISKLIVVCLTS